MPDWEPNWQDVRWNHGVAAETAAALQRSAEALEQTAAERTRAVMALLSDWQGTYRMQNDEQLRQVEARDRDLAAALRRAAARVLDADRRARIEQARREREREEWEREARSEEERERQGQPNAQP